ncbi:gamma-glutamylcysteine ligase-like protein [Aeromonas phage BUCT695]|uniref:gamma-glutamylcysteine ligase-like protein n=1 Tax=Aeromonas phage BUCT695 TaxID=2908630 RepID=UPI0023293E4B|nr:gamma-glutamylcysteine ligase-like protein [Aeromonas phage BUCT695]UIW10517.1 gamma-glutamylcysteine ligase-like protein [Aeromonas phage BUCT695]
MPSNSSRRARVTQARPASYDIEEINEGYEPVPTPVEQVDWPAPSAATLEAISQLAARQQNRPRTMPFASMYGGGQGVGRSILEDVFGDSFTNVSIDDDQEDIMVTVGSHFHGRQTSYPAIQSHPMVNGTHLAGVEIELENLPNQRNRFRYWTAKSDGSLRNNGVEYVFSNPWGGYDLYNAAIELDSHLFNNQPDGSWRCSTHVHIDVRDMSAEQVKKMILAYTMYERILFKLSGEHRYKNNFCVALGFAQDQINILSRNWHKEHGDFLTSVHESWDKYSSINLLPMSNFGSIEFRISEAKWRKGRLLMLVNRFLSLKEMAMTFTGSEEEMIEYMMTVPLHTVMKKGLPRRLPDFTEDLEFGYKLCHDIISMAKIRRKQPPVGFLPDLNDGTTQFPSTSFSAGWEHIRERVNRSERGIEFPRRQPPVFTLKYLSDLNDLASDVNAQFDFNWFTNGLTSNAYDALFNEYRTYRRNNRR